jgi:uncharacterized cupin superfamily protein
MDEPFVVNLADAPARTHPRRAAVIELEPDGVHWRDVGVNVRVMAPGQPSGLYHSEQAQEDFLVLYGRCVAIIDEREHELRPGDFVHCPPGTAHVFVGAGDGPCAVVMIGSRPSDSLHYPVSEAAGGHGASATSATDDPDEAYAEWRRESWSPASGVWRPR